MADPIRDLLDRAGGISQGAFRGAQPSGKPLVASAGDNDIPIEVRDGEEYYKAGLEEQKAFHPIWYRNIAMYAGQQWLDWNSQTNWFQETAAPSWRVRLTNNLIMPKVLAALATELQNNPRFYGMPSTGAPEAKDSARIASRIFEAKYFDDTFLTKMIRFRLWCRMTGSAYLFALWDPRAGRNWSENVDEAGNIVPAAAPALPSAGSATAFPPAPDSAVPMAVAAAPDANPGNPGEAVVAQPTVVSKDFAEGDIVYDIANSFEVILQPGAPEDFDLHRKIMRVKLMDIEEIEDNWGVKVSAEPVTIDIMYQVRVMSLVDASGRYRTSTSEGQVLKNKALVKDYFEVPSKKYPKGRHFTYANGKVLQVTEDLDYWFKGRRALPVSKDDDVLVPGRVQGGSRIEQIAPLNVQYNKMTSMTVENGNLMARPKWKAPKGSVEEDALTDQPGELIEYIPGPNGQGPEPMTPAEMPAYFFNQKAELKSNIEDIYGLHDVSMGRLPRRANSGVAIEALQSGDDNPLALNMKSCGASLSRVMSISLDQMQRKYTEERIVRMVGKDQEVAVISFKGSDLKGCDFVRVTFGAHLTRSQRIAMGGQLLQAQLITKDEYFELMELADLNMIFNGKDSFQTNYAKYENMGLAKGIAYPVGVMENHVAHIKTHLGYIQGEGAALPPEVAMVFKDHIDQHKACEMENFAGPQGIASASPSEAGAPTSAGGPPPLLPAAEGPGGAGGSEPGA